MTNHNEALASDKPRRAKPGVKTGLKAGSDVITEKRTNHNQQLATPARKRTAKKTATKATKRAAK